MFGFSGERAEPSTTAALLQNIPAFVAILAAAMGSWIVVYQWGVEGRMAFANRAENAACRADALARVAFELDDALPGVIPDLRGCATREHDDQPNLSIAAGVQ